MKYKILITTLVIVQLTYAQDIDYTDHFTDSIAELEGGNKKNIERMNKIWGVRLHPYGDFKKANDNIFKYYKKYNNQNKSSYVNTKSANLKSGGFHQPNWRSIGYDDMPINGSGYSADYTGMGQIHCIEFDPNYNGTTNKTIYAGTPFGGLWKSTNDGNVWTNLNTDFLPIASVSDIAINPNDGDDIFITTGNGDAGITKYTYSPSRAAVNPIWTIGVYRSQDGGEVWEPINSGLLSYFNNGGAMRRIIINPDDTNEIFVATSEGLFRTTNGLATIPTWYRLN